MLLKQRRYAIVVERLESGSWRVGVPAMKLWVANPIQTIAKRILRNKINQAVKLIEKGKVELPDSDAVDDNQWWEVRIYTSKSDPQ